MFPALQAEVMERFTAVEQHFRKFPKLPPDSAQTEKGLVFVQIYGIYEYTTRTAMRLTINEIKSAGHTLQTLRPSLLALFLNAEMESLRQVGEDKQWDRRINLFERSVSSELLPMVEVAPHDGTHFKHTHLQMIFRTFGIEQDVTERKRDLYQIDEIVSNRHKVAHGEETPSDIGRRYSRSEVLRQIKFMKNFCFRLIFVMSEHCSKPDRHCR